MSIRLAEDMNCVFLQRSPSKLPKVEPAFNRISQKPRTKTDWLRWPFHRLSSLREERMKVASVSLLKPLRDADDAEEGLEICPYVEKTGPIEHIMSGVIEKRKPGRRGVMEHASGSIAVANCEKMNESDYKPVKRRQKHSNLSECNGSVQRNKRMSYPPCDTVGLHTYLERLHTKEHRNPKSHLVDDSRLLQAFSTSCPALYHAKCAERLSSDNDPLHCRRSESRQHGKVEKTIYGQITGIKHHPQKGRESALSDQTKHHKNHMKHKVRKTKSSRDISCRPQRPKPPSWQDQSAGPVPRSVTITDSLRNDTQLSYVVEKEQFGSSTAKAESDIAATVQDTDARCVNRQFSGLGRSHLKRTRSRVIDTREIPKEDSVIPLSKTQQHEFNLKETHHDNRIYLNENAQKCRKWLANLEVEDLRDENPVSMSALSDSNETILFDFEVSHGSWNYREPSHPSDSESENN